MLFRTFFSVSVFVAVLVASGVGSAQDGAGNLRRVVFVIISQPNAFHLAMAKKTKENLLQNLRNHEVDDPKVLLLDEELPLHGSWTIFPLIQILDEDYGGGDVNWFVFLAENAEVNVENLKLILDKYMPEDELFIGHALRDKDNSIIHHFADPKLLSYPAFKAGFVISFKLIETLAKRLKKFSDNAGGFPRDFSIDPQHELAKFIRSADKDGYDDDDEVIREPGPFLIHEPGFCLKEGKECAMYPRPESYNCSASESEVIDLLKKTFFAVKTCEKYHKERLPVIRETWAASAFNVEYFSEVEDPEFKTLVLPGVKNTEKGHCKKTTSIIQYFNENLKSRGWDWLVIADDDTILSVQKLMEQLKCYDPDDQVALGQRYGYRVTSGTYGYDYLTGGGGMVFSRAATLKMMKSPEICTCPRDDHPDDMHLGACMSNMGVALVHNDRFHQARPDDYSQTLLESQDPLSFHKFWNADPRKIYDDWFRDSDLNLKNFKYSSLHHHEEL